MALAGAKLIILPAAFNMTTGPAHWDITMRMRALDNQVYFAANSPARDEEGVYVAYGNSCIVDPWGRFTAHCDEKGRYNIRRYRSGICRLGQRSASSA